MAILEWFSASTFYSMGRDLFSFILKRRTGSAREQLERQAKWKPIFEEMIAIRRRDGIRSDVILRDFRRLRQYPDTSDDDRISAWFRVGLVGIYHSGIEVAFGIHSLVYEES